MKVRKLREAIETAEALGCPVVLCDSRVPGVCLPLNEAWAVVALIEQALELTTCEDQVLFYRNRSRDYSSAAVRFSC